MLKPNLLIKASSSSSLNTLGFGLPYCSNGVMVPASTNPKRIYIKSVELENGDLKETEVWDCTEEEHESNGWGVIPTACKDALGVYASPDHLEIDPSEYA